MKRLFAEMKTDLDFMRTHTLQPGWYKVLKVFILLGVLAGYWLAFGWRKTVVFFAAFAALSLAVHFTYRVKTHTWTTSWLDFIVVEEDGRLKNKRIGKFYYGAVILDAVLSFLFSQAIVRG